MRCDTARAPLRPPSTATSAPTSAFPSHPFGTESSVVQSSTSNTSGRDSPKLAEALLGVMLSESTRILCPLVTPFDNGAVDHDALGSLVSHLADRGIDGFVPCGTTGEFASLTPGERRAVIETTVEASPDDAPVIAGAAGTAIETVREHVDEAASVGADAALIPPPYYQTATESAGNRRFFEAVADDSALPIYLYNIPNVVHSEIAPETVEHLAKHDRIAGLKDSSGDLTHVTDVLNRVSDDFDVMQGFDGQLVPGRYMGMDAGINALSQVVPDVLIAADDAVREGNHDEARAVQRERIGPLFQLGREYGFAEATKVLLVERGLLDTAEVRPPLVLPDDDGRAEIQERLSAVTDSDD